MNIANSKTMFNQYSIKSNATGAFNSVRTSSISGVKSQENDKKVANQTKKNNAFSQLLQRNANDQKSQSNFESLDKMVAAQLLQSYQVVQNAKEKNSFEGKHKFRNNKNETNQHMNFIKVDQTLQSKDLKKFHQSSSKRSSSNSSTNNYQLSNLKLKEKQEQQYENLVQLEEVLYKKLFNQLKSELMKVLDQQFSSVMGSFQNDKRLSNILSGQGGVTTLVSKENSLNHEDNLTNQVGTQTQKVQFKEIFTKRVRSEQRIEKNPYTQAPNKLSTSLNEIECQVPLMHDYISKKKESQSPALIDTTIQHDESIPQKPNKGHKKLRLDLSIIQNKMSSSPKNLRYSNDDNDTDLKELSKHQSISSNESRVNYSDQKISQEPLTQLVKQISKKSDFSKLSLGNYQLKQQSSLFSNGLGLEEEKEPLSQREINIGVGLIENKIEYIQPKTSRVSNQPIIQYNSHNINSYQHYQTNNNSNIKNNQIQKMNQQTPEMIQEENDENVVFDALDTKNQLKGFNGWPWHNYEKFSSRRDKENCKEKKSYHSSSASNSRKTCGKNIQPLTQRKQWHQLTLNNV